MAAPSSIDHPIRPAPSAWRRWLPRIVVLAMVAWFGWYAYQRVVLEPDPRTEYWQAQVDQLCPIPSDAMPLDELAQLLGARPWEPTTRPLGTTNTYEIRILCLGPWNAPDRPDHELYVGLLESDPVDDARAQMLAAVKKPWPLRLNIDIYPSGLGPFKWMAFLLSDARYRIENSQNLTRAFENFTTILEISRKYQRIEASAYLLKTASLQTCVADELVYLANEHRGPWPIDALANLILSEPATIEDPSERLAVDRLLQHYTLDKNYFADSGHLDVAGCFAGFAMAGAPKPSRLWNLTSPLFYSRSEMESQYDAYWQALDNCESLHDIARFDREHDRDDRFQWPNLDPPIKPDPCAGELHYSWKSGPIYIIKRIYTSQTKIEAAITCLALSNYREATANYPDTLDELVPTYLPRLPIDYVTMKPLRYKRTDQRYLLYSVGLDGIDNGGTENKTNREMIAWEENDTDIIFSDHTRPGLPQ